MDGLLSYHIDLILVIKTMKPFQNWNVPKMLLLKKLFITQKRCIHLIGALVLIGTVVILILDDSHPVVLGFLGVCCLFFEDIRYLADKFML